jgi:hypothetical protein
VAQAVFPKDRKPINFIDKAVVTMELQQLFIFCLAAKADALTFAPRSRAAVARWAHNPKVGSSILPFATQESAIRRIFKFEPSGGLVKAEQVLR